VGQESYAKEKDTDGSGGTVLTDRKSAARKPDSASVTAEGTNDLRGAKAKKSE